MFSLGKTSYSTRPKDIAANTNLDTSDMVTTNPVPKIGDVDLSTRTSSSATPTLPGAWKSSFETEANSSSLTLTDPAKSYSIGEAEQASANSTLNDNSQPQTTTELEATATNPNMEKSSSAPTLPLPSKLTYGFGLDAVDPEPEASATTPKQEDSDLLAPTFQQTQLSESLQDKNSDALVSTKAEDNDTVWPNRQSSPERKHSPESLTIREPEATVANATGAAAKMEIFDKAPTAEEIALHRQASSVSPDSNPAYFTPDNNTKPLPEPPAPPFSPALYTNSQSTPTYPDSRPPNETPIQGPPVFTSGREGSSPPRKYEGPKWLEDMMAAKGARQDAEASSPPPPPLPPRKYPSQRPNFALRKSSTSNALSASKHENAKPGKDTSWEEVNLREPPLPSPAGPPENIGAEQSPEGEDAKGQGAKIGQAATLADLRALDAKIPWETPAASGSAAKGKTKGRGARDRLKAALGKGKEIASFVGTQMKRGEFPWTQWYCCGEVNGAECETVNSRFRGGGRCKKCGHMVCGNCVKAVLGG